MDDVQRCHETLLHQRTQIRNHKTTLQWMKRCWNAGPHASAKCISRDEYEDLYSILLYEMTICWEEELNDAILDKMWKRDGGGHADLNFDRFCCSIFSFIEMWVEEITLSEYEKIFSHVYLIVSGQEHMSPSRRGTSPPEGTFKPTLESFGTALDNEKAMEQQQMNFGKSISFNVQLYYEHFGTPTTHLQAFQATLLQMQTRVRGEESLTTHKMSSQRAMAGIPSSRTQRSSPRRIEVEKTNSPSSPMKPKSERIIGALQRPMSSSGRPRYVLESDEMTGVKPPSPTSHLQLHGKPKSRSPVRNSPTNEPFVVTGNPALRPPAERQRFRIDKLE